MLQVQCALQVCVMFSLQISHWNTLLLLLYILHKLTSLPVNDVHVLYLYRDGVTLHHVIITIRLLWISVNLMPVGCWRNQATCVSAAIHNRHYTAYHNGTRHQGPSTQSNNDWQSNFISEARLISQNQL
jgi:hypothetical protein